MARTTGAALLLGLLLGPVVGCVADTRPLDPTARPDAAVVDDGGGVIVEPRPASVFDPEAALVIPAPAVITAPTARLGQLQGGDFELVWTGRRYVFAWVANVGGHLFVHTAALDPADGALSDVRVLSRDYEDAAEAAETVALAWHPDGFVAVAWASQREVLHARLDAEGRPLGDVVSTWRHDQPWYPALQLLPSGAGHRLLVGTFLDGAPRAFVLHVDADGRALGGPPASFDLTGPAALDARGDLLVSWGRRTPSGGQVHLATIDPEDRPIELERVVYAAANTTPLALGPPGAARYAAVWDFDAGSLLLDLQGGVRAPLSDPGYGHPELAFEPGGPRLVVVHEAGEHRPTNPLPNRVEVEALEVDTGLRGERRLVYDGRVDGTCLERVATAVAGDRLGVAWVMGCATRVLRFVELRAERGD